MKNIVFDLGGVVFSRDPQKCTPEFIDFFSFVRTDPMPDFWVEYDRGTLTVDEVKDIMCREKGCTPALCDEYLHDAICKQETIAPTGELIAELKAAGYKLYVLSNMSREFIDFLRQMPVYRHFDGEVISCEELKVKPEPEIYRILLSRYGLDPSLTMFIDDRQANLDAAARFGISTFLFRHHAPSESCEEIRKILL